MSDKTLIIQLEFLLEYSAKIYNQYILNGKTYLHAKILKQINEDIRTFLIANASNFNDEKRNAIMDLIYHIDIWRCLWQEYYDIQTPKLGEKFAFDNDVNFPHDSLKKILN